MKLFVYASLALGMLAGCATVSQQSDLQGGSKAKNKADRNYKCEMKVLYVDAKEKPRVAKHYKPYFFEGDWQFHQSSNKHTKVTARQCKNLARMIHHRFNLNVGKDEQGLPVYAQPEVLGVYWENSDQAFAHDSHGIVCSDRAKDTAAKNDVYRAFKYSCGHEYFSNLK